MKKNSRAIPAKIDIARLKIIEELPIGDYIVKKGLFTGDLEINGKMLCPVHDDKNPSCFYNTEKNVYNCFSCGSKGTVVEMDYGIHKREDDSENIVKTILRLSREFNISIPDMFSYETSQSPKRKKVEKIDLRRNRTSSPEQTEAIYSRKIERLEEKLRNPISKDEDGNNVYLSPEERRFFYHVIDLVLLEKLKASEVYPQIKEHLNR